MFFTIISILLALMFLMAGMMKLFMYSKARVRMPVLDEYSQSFVRFIAVAEIAGALGLVLPVWTGIMPFLTPLAAIGLMLIMVGAMVKVHIPRGEKKEAMMNVMLFVLLGLVLYSTRGLLGL